MERIAVIGLGYVGLPLALALGKHYSVIGFDVDDERVAQLDARIDQTGECEEAEFDGCSVHFSADESALKEVDVFIVAVPTPVDRSNYPDLTPLVSATELVARHLRPGGGVIFESTVYPGATEEVCVPILEAGSGLTCNREFFVGYSPERVNPGDREHRLKDIVKVTSGSSSEAARKVDAIYSQIIEAGTHIAPTIRVAEAAKAIENTQRDVNIALINELAMLFNRVGIDTQAVLEAASTKWNFLRFTPGLVGGHCIGVDPYYLIHKAQEAGFHPELILAARRINDGMARHVTNQVLRLLAKNRVAVVGARVLVLGLTFKENCPDLRNTQVLPIIRELQEFHAEVEVYDPWVDADGLDVALVDQPRGQYQAIILAVAHRQFLALDRNWFTERLAEAGVIYDVKQALPAEWVDGRL